MQFIYKSLVLTLIALPLLAQISSPKVGIARYADGSFHSVNGLPSNMIVADLPLDSAQAASFSDAGGLIAQNGSIRLLDSAFSLIAEFPCSESPLVSIEGELTSALAWLPTAHTLVHWNGSKFETFDISEADLDGTVTGVQSEGSKRARLIVLHTDNTVSGVTVSLRNGNLITSEPLPGVRGYAFGQGLFIVFALDKELVVDNLNGYRRSLPIPASDLVMERMSNAWIHLYSPSLQQSWALRLTQADLHLSILPGLAIASSTRGIK